MQLSVGQGRNKVCGLLLVVYLIIPSLTYAGSQDIEVAINGYASCVARHGAKACGNGGCFAYWSDGWYATLDLPQNFTKVTVAQIVSYEDDITYKVNDNVILEEPYRWGCWPMPVYYPDIDITAIVHAGSNTIAGHAWRWPFCMWDFHSCTPGWFIFHVETGDIIMKKGAGDGQTGDICKPLPKPFVVSVESENGAPLQGDFQVDWQITNSPAGSGRLNGEVIEQEAAKVIFKRTLELGEKTGEYKTKATCANCTAGSPQTFTATAKCPDVPIYRQYDYPQPYDSICKDYDHPKADGTPGVKPCLSENDERWNIGAKGCALTSAAMVMKMYGYGELNPSALNQSMNTIGGYDVGGNFNFEKLIDLTDPDLIVYKRNLEGRETVIPNSEMDGWLEMCIPVAVWVKNRSHWVVVTKKVGSDYEINDPGHRGYTRLSQYGSKIYAYRALYKAEGVCAK